MTKSKTLPPRVHPATGGRFIRDKATGGIAVEQAQKEGAAPLDPSAEAGAPETDTPAAPKDVSPRKPKGT